MSEEELNSWRLLVQTLNQYGLYDLLQKEITDVRKCLERCKLHE